jgi:Cu-Zn family superoxide dismutase
MRTIPILSVCAVVLAGCGPKESPPATDTAMASTRDSSAAAGAMSGSTMGATSGGAMATIKDATGRDLGVLMVTDAGGSLSLTGTLRGLTPGEHGIHLHATGACDAPAFTSAGGHWNPTTKLHGSQNAQGPHLGDLMNITVGADSTATVQLTTTGGSLRGADTLMDPDGAAIVVHAKADDYKTDPSGNSGDRVACGVITGG